MSSGGQGRDLYGPVPAQQDDFWFGWLVAMIEAEGWIGYSETPAIRFTSTDRDTAERFGSLVNRPVKTRARTGRKDEYSVSIYGEHALPLMDRIYVYLSTHRKRQVDRVRAILRV